MEEGEEGQFMLFKNGMESRPWLMLFPKHAVPYLSTALPFWTDPSRTSSNVSAFGTSARQSFVSMHS